jgi:hypothetical protein
MPFLKDVSVAESGGNGLGIAAASRLVFPRVRRLLRGVTETLPKKRGTRTSTKLAASGLIFLLSPASAFAAQDCKGPNCGAVVHPILTCVVQQDESHFTAVFGYRNDSPQIVGIPIGDNNMFLADPLDQDQPTSFRPGRHPGVFDVIFQGELAWKVGKEIAVASQKSRRCPLACPPDQGVDPQGQCLPLEQDRERVIKEDDVHDTGPDFATQTEAESFIIDTVRSKSLGDVDTINSSDQSKGRAVGLTTRSTLVGPVFVPHEDGTIETFDDKFALAFGGRAGLFSVGGQQVCVRDDGCIANSQTEGQEVIALQAPPGRFCPFLIRASCAVCDNEFCTSNLSFRNQSSVFRLLYCSVGGATAQASGGYQEDTHWCTKWGFIPWRCTTKRGTNFLHNHISAIRGGESHGKSEGRRDVTILTTKFSSWFAPGSFECGAMSVHTFHEASGNSSSRTGPDNRELTAETLDE